ncbi:hypothetical protein ACFL1C_03755 [Pseudomonadota bacterium]
MILGIDVNLDWIDRSIDFVKESGGGKRSKVLNHATIATLRDLTDKMTALVIPQKTAHADFNYKKFIAHIRVDDDERLAKMPMLVVANDDDKFIDFLYSRGEIDAEFYESIAVVVTEDLRPEMLKYKVDENRLAFFRRHQAEQKPSEDGGRHDQANAWGAFSVLHFLSYAKPGVVNQEEYERVKGKLSEDVYYKIKIQELVDEKPSQRLVDLAVSERGKLLKKFNDDSPILVVEDQLGDGWKHAYEALFDSSARGGTRIRFAENETEACDLFNRETKLVLLDVRLANDRANNNQFETDQDVDQFGGVRLARWFGEEGPAVPIIAATASNKSWTLNALLDRGINAYWVKEMPGHVDQANHAAENVIDFYQKLNSTLVWSDKTRKWVEAGYSIHKTVDKFDLVVGKRLLFKARSLHALLHRAPSPFADELAKGLQFNLSFLVLFSFMNDLVSWICRIEIDSEADRVTWYLDYEGQKKPLVIERKKESNAGPKSELVFDLFHLNPEIPDRLDLWDFPDSKAAIEMLFRMGLGFEASSFIKLNKIRNGLPLIHGKPGGVGTTSKAIKSVSENDITLLVSVLKALVKKYTIWLESAG